jgi:hypothetical protein
MRISLRYTSCTKLPESAKIVKDYFSMGEELLRIQLHANKLIKDGNHGHGLGDLGCIWRKQSGMIES